MDKRYFEDRNLDQEKHSAVTYKISAVLDLSRKTKLRFVLHNQEDIDELSEIVKKFPNISSLHLFVGTNITPQMLRQFNSDNSQIKTYKLTLSIRAANGNFCEQFGADTLICSRFSANIRY